MLTNRRKFLMGAAALVAAPLVVAEAKPTYFLKWKQKLPGGQWETKTRTVTGLRNDLTYDVIADTLPNGTIIFDFRAKP
jgi:hypothetical protein